MKKTHFCPGAGAGTTRDTRPRDTPGHGHGARPGTPRDTHPGHPGTTCIYEGRGARDLIRDKGPKRNQKYKTYRYIVLCWGGEKDVALVSVRSGILCPGPRLRCSVPASDGLSTVFGRVSCEFEFLVSSFCFIVTGRLQPGLCQRGCRGREDHRGPWLHVFGQSE